MMCFQVKQDTLAQMTYAQEGIIATAGVHFIVMAVVAVYRMLVLVSVLVTGCMNRGRRRL